jgi:mannose-6-phosphate isomerase
MALGAARRAAVSRDEISSWRRRRADAPELRAGARAVLPPESAPFFRAEWLRPGPTVELEPAFAVLVTVAGSGRLATEAGELELSRGDTVLVPYAAGAGEVTGEVEAIRCLPPASGVSP